MTDPEKKTQDHQPPPLVEAPKFKGLKKAFSGGEAQALAQASAVGMTFAVAIVLGLAAGWWLDKKFGTAPWGLLGGILVGILAGFKNLFTLSDRLEKMNQKKTDDKDAAIRKKND